MRIDETVRRVIILAVATLIGFVTLTVLALFVPAIRQFVFPGQIATDAYSVGDAVDVPASFFESSERTLLVFARSSCGGCQRAKPLLTKAIGRFREDPRAAVRLFTTGRIQAEEDAYGRELGLEPDEVLPVPEDVRLKSVPTLVVVDGSGRILLSWEGVVYSEDMEKEILEDLDDVIASR